MAYGMMNLVSLSAIVSALGLLPSLQPETTGSPLVIEARVGPPQLLAPVKYPDALKVSVSGPPAEHVKKIRAEVVSGDALLWTENGPSSRSVVANFSGTIAIISLETVKPGPLTIEVAALGKDETAALGRTFITGSVSSGYHGTFLSRRVSSELFLGATFANEFDEQAVNTGFGEASPVARLSFDTLWHPGTNAFGGHGGSEKQLPQRGAGLVHTGLEIQFASFPFGGSVLPGTRNLERDDAITGGIYLLYQPDRYFASYTATSDRPERPFDAIRFGLLVKSGLTTRRSSRPVDGDTSIQRWSAGLKFTHHQTRASRAIDEAENITPVRFVEVLWVRFEEFAGRRNTDRLVFDAGMRLPGLGSNVIPFYGGIHLNAGRGPDDIRVFAGFLFQLDEISRLFQAAREP